MAQTYTMNVWRGPAETGQISTPRAVRLRVSRWRDPRLLLGLLLVVGAAVGGGRIIAASDNTDPYWTVASSVQAGDQLDEVQLKTTRLRLSGDAEGIYLRADDEFPADLADLQWAYDARPGMLISPEAFEAISATPTSEFPLLVASGSLPSDLARGDRVDVWVAPENSQGVDAVRVLNGVRVLSSGDDPSALGGSLTRTVLIDVGSADVDGEVVAAVAAGHVTLIRVS